MTVNGKMIESKGKEYSIGIREINMKEIGKNINRKEIAFSNIKLDRSMVIDMKADWEMKKKEGKGIYCFKNGDKRMGDFFNGEHVGKHVTLTKDGEVKAEYFSLKLWI